jgi:hypothetical protein
VSKKRGNIGTLGVQAVSISEESLNLDAFGRLRVSDPTTVFDAGHEYNVNPLVWDDSLSTGTGAVTHLPDESAAQLSTGGTLANAKAVLQTRAYHRYQPGKSQLVLCTGAFGAAVTNARRRYGYFDANNGVFFEQTAAGMNIVLRSSTTGSVVERRVAQSAWNYDKLDGTGLSGVNVDFSKAQIYLFDLEWLGVGRVRCGIVIGGAIIYCHEFGHANELTGPYMTTANLPVRAEVENTGVTAAAVTMKQVCASVISEGGQEDDRAFLHSTSNGITTVAVTTRRAVLTIRPKLLFNSITNRGQAIVSELNLFSDASAFYEIVVGGTLGGTPSWVSVNDASIVERDVAGTTVTGGVVVASNYVATSGPGQVRAIGTNGILGRLPLVLNAAGDAADLLSVVVTSFSGTANVSASVTWREFR